MTDMLEMVIDSIRVSLMSPQRVVVLRQRDVHKYLPIWVGAYEAEAITIALQEVEVARPLTQDLIKNIITIFGGNVLRVEVVALKEDIYFANIVVERDGSILDIDSRPSDAIALAVRAHAPILVHRSVLEAAAITPEKDLQETASHEAALTTSLESIEPHELNEPRESIDSVEPPLAGKADDGRLDVFEDFLKKIGGEPPEEKPKE